MKLYWHYFCLHVQSAMEFKASFIMLCIGQFLISFNVFLGLTFMFSRFHQVKGFTYSEVMLCFGIVLLQFSLAECFARGFDSFRRIIIQGEFDRILLRPKSTILQVLGTKIELTRLGRTFQGVILFIYGLYQSEIEWTATKIFTIVMMVLGGTVVFACIFLVYATFCFFTLDGLEFMNVFTDGAREFGKYPISIYGKKILQFCTFVIPYALVQYYPLMYVLGHNTKWYTMFYPLLAMMFIVPCYAFWRLGRKHYQSVGS